MIVYFSATGNCKFVADKIANALGDKSCSILDIDEINIRGENLGFVFPTYFWALPSIVEDFFKNTEINVKDSYVYLIATYGTSTGRMDTVVEKYIDLDAKFKVKMPDTWTPTFDLSDSKKVAAMNQNEIPQINKIITHIQNRDYGDYIKSRIPKFSLKIAKRQYDKARKTSNFNIEESCIGCGLCMKKCPINAIEIKDKKPVWVKDKCTICLSCLHHCPSFAIQYKNRTKNHGQYTHP